jgi:hypothetical protein
MSESRDAPFLLITVSQAASLPSLERLLSSLARQSTSVELLLVVRGEPFELPPMPSHLAVHTVSQPLATGLSRARNAGLAYARQEGSLAEAKIVAFPDDDCVYPDGLLARVRPLVNPSRSVVCGPYGPSVDAVDWERFPATPLKLTPRLVMRVVSSNNVFLAAPVVAQVGSFDERLGLGASYGASEDADYVMRALWSGAAGEYRPQDVFVEHPYKVHRPMQYYVGNVAVLAKHARRRGGTLPSLILRAAHGLPLVLRRQLALREYAAALAAVVHMTYSRGD